MSDERDYYAVLGVPPDADAEQLKAARRDKLRALHPDLNQDDPGAADRFIEIYKICEVLCDPIRRELYDRTSSAASGTRTGPHPERMRCGACAGSGAYDFVKCDECLGLGRLGMGFSPTCWRCGGHGRRPVKCSRCEGRGWNFRSPGPPKQRDASRARTKSKPKAPPTCYEILGVPPDAAPDLITERYALMLQAHLARMRGERHEEGVVIDIDAVEQAYRRLGDPRRRAGYDRKIGHRPSRGMQDAIEIHVSRRCAREGDDAYRVQVSDAEICHKCRGLGRHDGGSGATVMDCSLCDRAGWVAVTREIGCRVPAGAREGDLITAHDALMGTFDLRVRLALIPSFARRPRPRT